MVTETEPSLQPDLLRNRARSEPHRAALIVDGKGSMSYGEWDIKSNIIARHLVQRGVAVGDRIATYFENAEWLDFAAAYFGVLKAGAVAVPLSSRFSAQELTAILDRCAAVGVICGEPFQVAVAQENLAEILYTSGTTGTSKDVACRHIM